MRMRSGLSIRSITRRKCFPLPFFSFNLPSLPKCQSIAQVCSRQCHIHAIDVGQFTCDGVLEGNRGPCGSLHCKIITE